jgi:circadian clock protein KaiB
MSRPPIFKLRLYIAGGTQNSALAMANLNTLCRVHLPDRYQIEIVDVLREPKRALKDEINMTPTLVKLMPAPVRRIVGTLNQGSFVLHTLGVEPLAS